MPTYSYQCQECNHELELFQSIMADPIKDCPECKEPALKRLIGPGAGFIFKGSGFYTTDYRSKEYKDKAKKESGKSDSSSESKEKSDKSATSEPSSKESSRVKTKPQDSTSKSA